MNTLVHRVVASLIIAAVLGVAACTPAAPGPTETPSKPGATSAAPAKPTIGTETKSATPATPSSKPAASPSAKPAASADWKAEWDRVLAEAKKEGKVVVAGGAGDPYRNAAMAFQKAYPDIQLEYTGGSAGNVHAPKILAERDSGLYLWDVVQGAGSIMVDTFIPQKTLAPFRPALILPEVVNDSNWLGGLDSGWVDLAHQYSYSPFPYLNYTVQVNREVAPATELRTVEDLLDPKWKSKIGWGDPRMAGSGQSTARYFYYLKGADWLRRLLSQDIVVTRDPRGLLENLIRGSYPIAIGTRDDEINEFAKAGLTAQLEFLDPSSTPGGYLTSGSSSIAILDKAPHPNAAKVFVNWYMTRSAAEAYIAEPGLASLRLDVDSPPQKKPRPGDINIQSEQFLVKVIPAAENLIKDVVK